MPSVPRNRIETNGFSENPLLAELREAHQEALATLKEVGKIRSALREKKAAYREALERHFEVSERIKSQRTAGVGDRPNDEPRWRSFKVMTTRQGDGADLVEGRGITLQDAIRHAREDILAEAPGMLAIGRKADDRLVVEGDVLREIVHANEVLRDADRGGASDVA